MIAMINNIARTVPRNFLSSRFASLRVLLIPSYEKNRAVNKGEKPKEEKEEEEEEDDEAMGGGLGG